MSLNTDFVPFSQPVMGLEEEEAVLNVLRSGWLTTGKVCAAFEEEFASFCGISHALAVNSATAGLHLALESLGVGPNDLCAVPDYTFTATAAVAHYLGAHLVFVDCLKDSPNMDMDALEAILRVKKIKVVLPVHLLGEAVDWDRLMVLRDRYGFFVVEDAAHTFPACFKGKLMGTLGDIGVYSFYANKNITTGEGGMVVTNDVMLAKRIKMLRLHGIDRDAFERYTSPKASWKYQILAPGFKYNMTDLSAALGRVQLRKATLFWQQRQKLVRRYNDFFAKAGFLEPPVWRDDHAWHVYAVLLKDSWKELRDTFGERLQEKGVGISVHYIPLHNMPYWKKYYSLQKDRFPQAQKRYEKTLSLPLFPSMSIDQQDFVICKVLETAAELGKGHV